ncbi:hypothetical protein BDR04DRAFT_1156379 [Suillus decipiens]|nr:hypothetical protein BDR04DRAFT_1156379 [Suillus decipiens]
MYEWGMEKELHQRGVQIKDLTCSKDGGVASLSHTWFHLTTVTITMWVLYPDQDNQGLQKVKCIFQHALENVHDVVVKHLQTEHMCDQALLTSLQNVKNWSPPSNILNWNKCNNELQAAANQMGFDRCRSWHRNFLKHVANEEEEDTPSTGMSKRAKCG